MRCFLLFLTLWLLAAPCPVALAQPPVWVQLKRAATPDRSDLARIGPEVKSALRKLKFAVLAPADTATARWRIDVSGYVDKCPVDANVPRYTLTLNAIDLAADERIAAVKATPNCLNLPTDELASRAVSALFENRAFERDRTAFFEKIRQHFGPAPTTPTDTAGPLIEIYSPTLSRGARPVGQVGLNAAVEVMGRATDPAGIARLTLNGQPVDISEQGIFRPTVRMTQTDYPVRFEATDALGNRRTLTIVLSPQANRLDSAAKPDVVVAEKRLALVVGNGAYQHVLPLANPVNDAEAVAVALSSLGFEVIRQTNVDRKTFIQLIKEFGERMAREQFNVGLVYYAGHGVQHKGLNYLVPVEATQDSDAETDFVEVQRIMNQMELANSRTNILILDACRDDPFKAGRTLGGAYGPPATMQAPVGTLIAFATAPGSTASDGTGKNGIYTEALLRHLPTPQQPISDLFLRVRQDVMQKTKNRQIPWESTSLTGNFFFRR